MGYILKQSLVKENQQNPNETLKKINSVYKTPLRKIMGKITDFKIKIGKSLQIFGCLFGQLVGCEAGSLYVTVTVLELAKQNRLD